MLEIVSLFFKTDLGRKSIKFMVGGVIILAIGIYIFILTNKLDSALEEKKQAENNIILITNEFYRLNDLKDQLEKDIIDQKLYHAYTVKVLKQRHDLELHRTTEMVKIKEGIRNVKEEDDGPVANILNDTLESLRLYK